MFIRYAIIFTLKIVPILYSNHLKYERALNYNYIKKNGFACF